MTEVLVYSTEEQADNDLERTFDRNNEVIGALERRFGELSDVNKWKEVGEQYELDCVFWIEKMSGTYFCNGGVISDCEALSVEDYSTLAELVIGIKKSLVSGGEIFTLYGAYGISVNPVFYTTLKHEQLGEEDKEVIVDNLTGIIRDAETEEEKKEAVLLSEFFRNAGAAIEGLSPFEIAEFVRLYDEV